MENITTTRTAHVLDSTKWRSLDIKIDEDINFSGLLLSDKVLTGLDASGFVRPSPIQLKAIPLGRSGLDLVVQAKSGTGKTCVFVVIALEKILLESKATQVLVLAPTREVAVQISQVVRNIGASYKGLQCHTFIGGMPLQDDKIRLRKCHIAVGTPGRIKQLIKQDLLKTNSIRLFVLDEADKLMEENFQECINWIYSSLPARKQMLALSATYPEELAQLLQMYMSNPAIVRLNAEKPALLGIAQFYSSTPHHPVQHVSFQSKIEALVKILNKVSFSQCLIFSNYQTRAESLCDILKKRGWPTEYISGGQEQTRRLHAIDRLKRFKCRVLISTDVTSRGIDAENVNLVINMDIPWEVETYLHRIGRAGRFGTKGLAISLVGSEEESKLFEEIKLKGNLQISVLPDPMPTDLWTYANENGMNSEQDELPENGNSEQKSELPVSGNLDVVFQNNCEPDILTKQQTSSTDNIISPLMEPPESKFELHQTELHEETGDQLKCLPIDPTNDDNDVNSILSYDELMLDFGKTLHVTENVENSAELSSECDDEMQALLNLSCFLVNSHEEFRLKLEDGFTKNDNSEVTNENVNIVESAEESPSDAVIKIVAETTKMDLNVADCTLDAKDSGLNINANCETANNSVSLEKPVGTSSIFVDDTKFISSFSQEEHKKQSMTGVEDKLCISNGQNGSQEYVNIETQVQIISEVSQEDVNVELPSQDNNKVQSIKKVTDEIDRMSIDTSQEAIPNEATKPSKICNTEKLVNDDSFNPVSKEKYKHQTANDVERVVKSIDSYATQKYKWKQIPSKTSHRQRTGTANNKTSSDSTSSSSSSEDRSNDRASKFNGNENNMASTSSRNRASTSSCSNNNNEIDSEMKPQSGRRSRAFHLPNHSQEPTTSRANVEYNAHYQAYLNEWWKPNTRMATVYLEYQRYMSHLLSRYS